MYFALKVGVSTERHYKLIDLAFGVRDVKTQETRKEIIEKY